MSWRYYSALLNLFILSLLKSRVIEIKEVTRERTRRINTKMNFRKMRKGTGDGWTPELGFPLPFPIRLHGIGPSSQRTLHIIITEIFRFVSEQITIRNDDIGKWLLTDTQVRFTTVCSEMLTAGTNCTVSSERQIDIHSLNREMSAVRWAQDADSKTYHLGQKRSIHNPHPDVYPVSCNALTE